MDYHRKGIQVLADGINAVGIVTATSFSGNITGNVAGNVSGELTGAAVTTSSAGLQATNVDFAGLLREQVNVVANKLSTSKYQS